MTRDQRTALHVQASVVKGEIVVPKGPRSARGFLQRLDEPGVVRPSEYLLGLINGEMEYDAVKANAATALLPYELPRMAPVQSDDVPKGDTTHEEALRALEADDDEMQAV